jgi:hypothetical protein
MGRFGLHHPRPAPCALGLWGPLAGLCVGSCVASVRSEVIKAHPANQLGCDAFRIDHGLIRRHLEIEVLLVDTPESTQIGAKCRTCSLTGIAMHFASAIPIIIPCPFVDAVADRGMGWMTVPVALPLISIQPRAASRKVFDDESMTSPPVRVVAHPKTLLARLARDDTDDGGPIVSVSAVAFALIGTSAWRVVGITMRCAFFPPRSGTAHLPRRQCQPSPLSEPSH